MIEKKTFLIWYIVIALAVGSFVYTATATTTTLTTPNLGNQCTIQQKLLGYDVSGNPICSNDLTGNGTSQTNSASNVIGIDGSITHISGGTLADLHKMNNQTLYGNTHVDYLTIKENLQMPIPQPGSINIRAEDGTHEIMSTDQTGNPIVLNKVNTFSIFIANATGGQHGWIQPNTPNQYGMAYNSNVQTSARFPISSGGTLGNFICKTHNDNLNMIHRIYLNENGGHVLTITIPPNGWGTTYINTTKLNFTPNSDMDIEPDFRGSQGMITVGCTFEIR